MPILVVLLASGAKASFIYICAKFAIKIEVSNGQVFPSCCSPFAAWPT